jgi:hypothetical protein
MMQRFFDIAISSLTLIVISPIIVIVGLLLRVTGEGEIFYRQNRIGKSGKEFKLLKFATMLKNSPNLGAGNITVADELVEVFVDTPLSVAEERDVKGLYARARSGQLKNFTGIDSPYEAPKTPEIRIDTTKMSIDDAAEKIVKQLLGE